MLPQKDHDLYKEEESPKSDFRSNTTAKKMRNKTRLLSTNKKQQQQQQQKKTKNILKINIMKKKRKRSEFSFLKGGGNKKDFKDAIIRAKKEYDEKISLYKQTLETLKENITQLIDEGSTIEIMSGKRQELVRLYDQLEKSGSVTNYITKFIQENFINFTLEEETLETLKNKNFITEGDIENYRKRRDALDKDLADLENAGQKQKQEREKREQERKAAEEQNRIYRENAEKERIERERASAEAKEKQEREEAAKKEEIEKEKAKIEENFKAKREAEEKEKEEREAKAKKIMNLRDNYEEKVKKYNIYNENILPNFLKKELENINKKIEKTVEEINKFEGVEKYINVRKVRELVKQQPCFKNFFTLKQTSYDQIVKLLKQYESYLGEIKDTTLRIGDKFTKMKTRTISLENDKAINTLTQELGQIDTIIGLIDTQLSSISDQINQHMETECDIDHKKIYEELISDISINGNEDVVTVVRNIRDKVEENNKKEKEYRKRAAKIQVLQNNIAFVEKINYSAKDDFENLAQRDIKQVIEECDQEKILKFYKYLSNKNLDQNTYLANIYLSKMIKIENDEKFTDVKEDFKKIKDYSYTKENIMKIQKEQDSYEQEINDWINNNKNIFETNIYLTKCVPYMNEILTLLKDKDRNQSKNILLLELCYKFAFEVATYSPSRESEAFWYKYNLKHEIIEDLVYNKNETHYQNIQNDSNKRIDDFYYKQQSTFSDFKTNLFRDRIFHTQVSKINSHYNSLISKCNEKLDREFTEYQKETFKSVCNYIVKTAFAKALDENFEKVIGSFVDRIKNRLRTPGEIFDLTSLDSKEKELETSQGRVIMEMPLEKIYIDFFNHFDDDNKITEQKQADFDKLWEDKKDKIIEEIKSYKKDDEKENKKSKIYSFIVTQDELNKVYNVIRKHKDIEGNDKTTTEHVHYETGDFVLYENHHDENEKETLTFKALLKLENNMGIFGKNMFHCAISDLQKAEFFGEFKSVFLTTEKLKVEFSQKDKKVAQGVKVFNEQTNVEDFEIYDKSNNLIASLDYSLPGTLMANIYNNDVFDDENIIKLFTVFMFDENLKPNQGLLRSAVAAFGKTQLRSIFDGSAVKTPLTSLWEWVNSPKKEEKKEATTKKEKVKKEEKKETIRVLVACPEIEEIAKTLPNNAEKKTKQQSIILKKAGNRILESCRRLQETNKDIYQDCKLPDIQKESWENDVFPFIKMFPFKNQIPLTRDENGKLIYQITSWTPSEKKFNDKINTCATETTTCYFNLIFLLNFFLHKSGRCESLFKPIHRIIDLHKDTISMDEEIIEYIKKFSKENKKNECYINIVIRYDKEKAHAVYVLLKKNKEDQGKIDMFIIDSNGDHYSTYYTNSENKYQKLYEIFKDKINDINIEYKGLITSEYNQHYIETKINTVCSVNEKGMCVLFSHYLTVLISLNPEFHPGDLQYIISKLGDEQRESSLKTFYTIMFNKIFNYEYIQFIFNYIYIIYLNMENPQFEINPEDDDLINIFFKLKSTYSYDDYDELLNRFNEAFKTIILNLKIKFMNSKDKVFEYLQKLEKQFEDRTVLEKQFIEQIKRDFEILDKEKVCEKQNLAGGGYIRLKNNRKLLLRKENIKKKSVQKSQTNNKKNTTATRKNFSKKK